MKEASKRRLAAKAHASNKKKNIKRLSPSERAEVKKKVKMLKAEILKEIHNVSQADKQVIDKVAEIRTKLLHAKTVRRDGNDYESEAREQVKKAARDRRLAEKYRRESEAAKRKFVSAEKPIELAMKLEAHDQRSYRKMQLAIAEHVTLLSEDPENNHMRALVHKLVASSKADKKRLEQDKHILHTLQDRTADASLSGTRGYASLRERSVTVAKKAEQLAESAVSMAKKGHKDRIAASNIVVKAEGAEVGPEELAAKAAAERAAYEARLKRLEQLHAELAVRSPKPQPAPPTAAPPAASKDSAAYRKDREELEKDLEKGGRRAAKRSHGDDDNDSDDDSDSSDDSGDKAGVGSKRARGGKDKAAVETAAERAYARLEAAAMHKEEHEAKKDQLFQRPHGADGDKDGGRKSGGGDRLSSSSDNGDSDDGKESDAAKAAARLRAHIISDKQSTFLMGLFSDKAPWDTDRDRAR